MITVKPREKRMRKIEALEIEEVELGEGVLEVEVEVKDNHMMVTLQKIM